MRHGFDRERRGWRWYRGKCFSDHIRCYNCILLLEEGSRWICGTDISQYYFFYRCDNDVNAHTQSVRNTLDEEERTDERGGSRNGGNFVEDIVADIDSLFDFSKGRNKSNRQKGEETTIELENLSLLEDFRRDSPRGQAKRRRSSRDNDEVMISLNVHDENEEVEESS